MPTYTPLKKFEIAALLVVSLFIILAIFSPQVPLIGRPRPAPTTTTATTEQNVFYKATVTKIIEEGIAEVDGLPQAYQKIELRILNGDEKGKTVTIDHGGLFAIDRYQRVAEGEAVVLSKPLNSPKENFYYIIDKYRATNLLVIAALFLVLVVGLGRKKGLTSVVGMLFSLVIIFKVIIPRIILGSDPLWTCLIGGICIMIVSLYLSHGFNKRTSIALLSTLVALGFALLIDILFVHLAKLSGTGTEDAFYLQLASAQIDLKGILLGAIIIGVLGVLDDVTTAQTATIEEISKANRALTFSQLYHSGLSVGREHIASLINTLLLAYAGASLPMFLLFYLQNNQPLWLTFNSNFLAEEIVRTLVGSAALILAIPITNAFAAYFYSRRAPLPLKPSTTREDSVAADNEALEQYWLEDK
ncbi:MAG TPA: YibE/F family protein [Patescibacteria group bacterium]|nr:YibE/F family protein [Patescibacteria group bacterium]